MAYGKNRELIGQTVTFGAGDAAGTGEVVSVVGTSVWIVDGTGTDRFEHLDEVTVTVDPAGG